MQKTIGRNVKIIIWVIILLDLVEGALLYFFPDNLGPIFWPTRLGTFGARFYGAVFLAIALGGFLFSRENDWARVRIVFLPAILFTALTFFAALLSFNQPAAGSFDAARIVSWLFLIFYATAAIAGIWIYWVYEMKK